MGKVSLARGEYTKEESHKLSKEAKADINYVNSAEWDKQIFEEHKQGPQ